MSEFVFKVLCRVLYSYLYEDETLGIPREEVVELEKLLVNEYKKFPHLVNALKTDNILFESISERLAYFASKQD